MDGHRLFFVPQTRETKTMSLDKDEVLKIANLARIRIEEDEIAAMQADLNKILGFIEMLGEVDTDGVAPMSSVARMKYRARKDDVTDGNMRDRILANAPQAIEGFFAVPKVVE